MSFEAMRQRAITLVCALAVALVATVAFAATFTLNPTSINFGNQLVGTTSAPPRTIVITNTAKSALIVTMTTTGADFAAVFSNCNGSGTPTATVPPGGNCTVQVTFTPVASGVRNGTILFTDTSKASNKMTASLTGTGVLPVTVSPTSLAFGNVGIGTSSVGRTFTVTNNQNAPLTINSISSSNGDYAIAGCSSPVAALSSCTATVIFTPTTPPGSSEPATITITHNAPGSPQTVSVTGTSVLAMTLSTSSLTFPGTFQGAASTQTLLLTNNLSVPLSGIQLATLAPFSATGCASSVAAAGTCTITVTFAPTVQAGPVSGLLTVTSPQSGNSPTANLSGTALQRITVAPSVLPFGSVTVASTSAGQQLTITNNSLSQITFGTPLVTFGGAAPSDFAQAATTCKAKLMAGANCTVTLTFHPTQGGTRTATAGINSNAFGSPHTANLTGIGTTPITVSPANVNFGSVNVGIQSASQLITIQNNQNIPVDFNAFSVTGDFAVQAVGTTCSLPADLGANASCTIAVAMTATVVGPRSGSLSIVSNTSESPNNFTLAGVGINAFTASPSSLTFASQTVGTTSAPQFITVTNHQAVPDAVTATPAGDFAASDGCSGLIPAGGTCAIAVTFTPTTTGTRSGSVTINNPGGSPIVIALSGNGVSAASPAITDVSPGSGTLGTTVAGVVVTGNNDTNFSLSSVVSFGSGITVQNLRDVSPHSLTVDLVIAGNATPGSRTVTVTTPLGGGGNEIASLSPGFSVVSTAALTLASIAPVQGKQGQSLSVAIVGNGTHFLQGVTFANFGDGISVVGTLTVVDQTHATANITISPTTTLGWRTVVLATGGEQASLTPVGGGGPGFNVVAGDAALTQITPNGGTQGAAAFTVTVTGSNTNFLQGATQLSLGNDINISNIQVSSPTQLTALLAVTLGASVGQRNVIAATGGEVAVLADGFTVIAAPPPTLSDISPIQGHQGDNFGLTITGSNTHFLTDPSPSLSLGSNITVSNVLVVDDDTITADVAINFLAFTGGRTGTLTSSGTIFNVPFTVLASAASITDVSPTNGPQGAAAVSIQVIGQGTHWQPGTTASFVSQGGCPVATVNFVTVNTPTSALLNVTIPTNACVGAESFQMATGGEVVGASFSVYQHTPSLVLSPSTSMAGTTVKVNFIGEFSHFQNGFTVPVINGTGVSIQNFVVTSPTSATATFVIASDAPAGGCATPTPGCHTVTLTTPLGGGAFEILTTAFNVVSTPALLTAIEPSHTAPDSITNVTIRGSFTHFADGQTTVGFGPDIAVGTPIVVSETELNVGVTVDASAAIGWRPVFVNTGDEQLTIGFHIDGEAAPTISNVNPSSGAQGQSLALVTITGANTNFNGLSQLILGAGVAVTDFDVIDPTTITATVEISPTAPVGPNAVIVITPLASGDEVVSGAGFSVVRGPAQILSISPNLAAQGQVLNVTLVGQGTNWLSGGTVASFADGIVVNQLTIDNLTHATAQITVLGSASLGFHTVSMLTDGEYVAKPQGLNVSQNTPTLTGSSPNVGVQNTTFNVQVLGSLTHWVQGQTTASYADSYVTVNTVTVQDSASAVLSVTVQPLAYVVGSPSCHSLTMTTGFEQVSLPNQLCVQPGAAVLATVSPNAAPQSATLTVAMTGQNTHFTAGQTTANFGPGINVGFVTVTSDTTASVDLAITSGATAGPRTATLTTAGEVARLQNAFAVGPNTPTLNAAAPTSGQQGQSLSVHLIGQYTHWVDGVTTVTFGEGIAVGTVTVQDPTNLDVSLSINQIAQVGGRTVTVTTGGEIVSAGVFAVAAGGAIITNATPQTGNQGQDIVLEIQGSNTTWLQGITQFGMSGAGGDIKISSVVIDSSTHATVGISISPTAQPGARSIYMVTGAEALVDANAFIVTGGVPAIASVSPSSAPVGSSSLDVAIAGLYTDWLTGQTTVDFGPGITVQNLIVDNDTHLTATIDVALGATIAGRTVVVRNVAQNVTQALTAHFDVVSNAPPTPFISYMSPTSGLRGQTFTINISGQHTHWSSNPAETTIDFGDPFTSGITINSFEVTSPTSARVNITIGANAAFGARTASIETDMQPGTEVVQTTFSVIQATPQLTLVDPPSGMQGETKTLNVLGQYTGFNDTTSFDFGSGITVNHVEVLGATVAKVDITIDQLAVTNPPTRFIMATTNGQLIGGATFTVTPSQAVIVSVTPNTAKQEDSIELAVVGANTHWNAGTVFSLGGAIQVSNTVVDADGTHATMTLSIGAFALLGVHGITATTGGEIATLSNAFVVQPGTPLLLSSAPAAAQQQANPVLTILGQYTDWQNNVTTVALGDGVLVGAVNVTTPTSLTAQVLIDPVTYLGPRTLTVTTDGQVLTLGSALTVIQGPAAIGLLTPAQVGQSETVDVNIAGVNTHFSQLSTVPSFGDPKITINSLTIHSPTSATANITVASDAQPGQRTVVLTTLGEVASIQHGLLVLQTTPYLQSVSPSSAQQGATLDVSVVGSLTSFTNSTTFDFGPGITVTDVDAINATHATVTVEISPLAAKTTRNVSATTNGVTATGANLFTVISGPAYISAVNPEVVSREQTGVDVVVSGNGTHFLGIAPNTPLVDFGAGIDVTQVSVVTDTQLHATINVADDAPVGVRNVVVTTSNEVASLSGVFEVEALPPVIVSAFPSSGYQEQTLNVTVTGAHTHFAQGATLASFGAGITANSVTVLNATQAIVNITIGSAATPGMRTVTLTTGAEVASGAALFEVLEKVTPVITWSTPADITYGTTLDGAQLNAEADVPGSFAYTPSAGTQLNAGTGQPLAVLFTPSDPIKYRSANATVYINVLKAAQTPALSITGAPSTFANGETFTVGTTGGSGDGVMTYAASGACTNTNGGAQITMAASGTGTCNIVATKAADNNYLQAVSAPALVVAEGKSFAANVVGGFNAARAGGFGLTDGGSLSSFRSDLSAKMPNATLAGAQTLTSGFLDGVDVALLSSVTGNTSAVTALSTAEQDALHNFVLGGGGAVIVVDNDSFAGVPNSGNVNNSFLTPFGMHAAGTDGNFSSAATIPDPLASPVTSGPFGAVSGINLVVPGWIDQLGPATSLGTLNVNGQPFLAVIPPNLLGPGSGAVVVMTEAELSSEFWNPAFRSLVLNAIAYVAPPSIADFEQGDLNGWTLTGNAWTVGGTTNTSPNITPISESNFARSGAPNVPFPGALAEANTGTATSPALTVTARTLRWYALGWSGPSYAGNSYFQILDGSLNEKARIPVPQSDSWVRLSVDLRAIGLSSGDTFYFRAVDGESADHYAWMAFDKLTLAGLLATLPQPTLSIIGAPFFAVNGTSFSVGTTGGAGTGAMTFAASGACINTNGGSLITMVSATGTCSIVATKAGDADYLQATSSPALVAARQPLNIVGPDLVGLAVGIPGSLTVNLLGAGGVPVAAPSDVALTVSSSNPQCVVVADALLLQGAFSVAVPIAHGTQVLPCQATVTITTATFGSDSVLVRVYQNNVSDFSGQTAVSYYNPAPLPDPAGTLRTGVAAISYYNPATIPTPDGAVKAAASSLSYYNPAPVPSPNGVLQTKTAALSYYNPSMLPSPDGQVKTTAPALSYYNPATVPLADGTVAANVAAVSYCNPDGTCAEAQSSGESQQLGPLTLESSSTEPGDAPASAAFSVSIANGPTASSIEPAQVKHSTINPYVVVVRGANLTGATLVRFVGVESDMAMGVPVVSDDGRQLTVDLYVLPTAPFAVVDVIVEGPGWSTPEVPTMRVEIVP